MKRKVFGKMIKIWEQEAIGVEFRRFILFEAEYFGLLIHRFDVTDEDAPPHDHGSSFLSFALSGGYREQIWKDPMGQFDETQMFTRRTPSLHYMNKQWAHRIVELVPGRNGGTTTFMFWFGKRGHLPNYYTPEGRMTFFEYWNVDSVRQLLKTDPRTLRPRVEITV
jgi:hypothetical protein